jgi:hypothetical protein
MWKYILLIVITVEVFGVSLDGVYFTLKDVLITSLTTVMDNNNIG